MWNRDVHSDRCCNCTYDHNCNHNFGVSYSRSPRFNQRTTSARNHQRSCR